MENAMSTSNVACTPVVPTKAGPASLQQSTHDDGSGADRIRGKTMRWAWTDGPTAGTTHEHVFNADGSMVWRVIDGPKAGKTGREKKYASEIVTDDVGVVSHLAESGYTITMILNFGNHGMTGFASNDKEWMPVKGTFEVVG
jgi:hypothetical protein